MEPIIAFFKNVNQCGASPWTVVAGGRYSLLVKADRFPSGLDFEMLKADGHTVALNSANINRRIEERFDLSVGSYRMNACGSSPADLSAILVRHG